MKRLRCSIGRDCYLSNPIKADQDDRQMQHIRSALFHPMTQGKSELSPLNEECGLAVQLSLSLVVGVGYR